MTAHTSAGFTSALANAASNTLKLTSTCLKPSGYGTWTKFRLAAISAGIQPLSAGLPPINWAPSVLPWNASSKLTITCLPRRIFWPQVMASFMQHSVASAPVDSTNTFRSGSGATWASFSTSPARSWLGKQYVASSDLLAVSTIALAMSGWPWPALVISTPEEKSSHMLP